MEAQRLFRLLGVIPGPEASREAAAVLLGRELSAPVLELDELLAAHLLSEPILGRYRSHDLLALYAKQLADTEPQETREPALHRLLSWYLLSLDAANRIIMPNGWVLFPDEFPLTGSPQTFSGPHDAQAWLAAEHANLITAAIHVSEYGPALRLAPGPRAARKLRCPPLGRGALAASQAGLRAAEARDHPLGRGMCHMCFGFIAMDIGDLDAALEEFNSAKIQFDRIGFARGLAAAWNDSAEVCTRSGRIVEALHHASTALTFHTDYAPSRAVHHANLAEIFRIQGNYTASQRHAQEALALAAGNGNPQTAAVAKRVAGMTHLAMGQLVPAEELLSEGRAAAEVVGSQNNLYDALRPGSPLRSCRACGRGTELDRAAAGSAGPGYTRLRTGGSRRNGDRRDVPRRKPNPPRNRIRCYRAGPPRGRGPRSNGHASARGPGTRARCRRRLRGRPVTLGGRAPHTIEESLPERADIEGLLADLQNCAGAE